MGLMVAFAAMAAVPAVAAECDPNEGPCGLRQPPNCPPPGSAPGAYVDCQVGALTSPCEDGCGFVPFAVGNALWACGVVLHAVTGQYCAP